MPQSTLAPITAVLLAPDAASAMVAHAVWKNVKGGTQTMAASYGR